MVPVPPQMKSVQKRTAVRVVMRVQKAHARKRTMI